MQQQTNMETNGKQPQAKPNQSKPNQAIPSYLVVGPSVKTLISAIFLRPLLNKLTNRKDFKKQKKINK